MKKWKDFLFFWPDLINFIWSTSSVLCIHPPVKDTNQHTRRKLVGPEHKPVHAHTNIYTEHSQCWPSRWAPPNQGPLAVILCVPAGCWAPPAAGGAWSASGSAPPAAQSNIHTCERIKLPLRRWNQDALFAGWMVGNENETWEETTPRWKKASVALGVIWWSDETNTLKTLQSQT